MAPSAPFALISLVLVMVAYSIDWLKRSNTTGGAKSLLLQPTTTSIGNMGSLVSREEEIGGQTEGSVPFFCSANAGMSRYYYTMLI
uniref:Putative secreted protein n=1 Tax=Anopheles darlingi TaxID=43151 RepID=A0A2M4DET0_ANODA